MCGIIGLKISNVDSIGRKRLKKTLAQLVTDAQERGRDSFGIYVQCGELEQLWKFQGAPDSFLKSLDLNQILDKIFEQKSKDILILGLSRLTMSGSAIDFDSIQPIITDNLLGVHNGIITKNGDTELATLCDLSQKSDSLSFFQTLSNKVENKTSSKVTIEAELENVEGSYSVAILALAEGKLFLASNTGSLYLTQMNNEDFVFTSEKSFVRHALVHLGAELETVKIEQIKGEVRELSVKDSGHTIQILPPKKTLQRCTRCILPRTYPFIDFDNAGVCNFCRSYRRQAVHGEEKLLRVLDKHRSKGRGPDCLVGLSGGRDSSYGLWALKVKYGMNPVAYTFDWGLTTDSSRRNQAIVCGKLGVEHILRAPDIGTRRRHIKKNIDAFLKSPDLGMVPLFMAGDKDFYHYGRKLRQELNVPLNIFCTGHEEERLHFKTGFCGVDDQDQHNVRLYDFSSLNKLKLAFYYAGQYLKNPSYVNESFYYSLRSFAYSFLQKDDFLYLYRFIQWDEKKIEKTLSEELGWKPDPKYGDNQWRMGDGQTAFTNYIYHTVAGFSEFDNFRANQVRAGLLERNEALRLTEMDNIPKWDVLKDFSMTVGFCLEDVVKKINQIPKL